MLSKLHGSCGFVKSSPVLLKKHNHQMAGASIHLLTFLLVFPEKLKFCNPELFKPIVCFFVSEVHTLKKFMNKKAEVAFLGTIENLLCFHNVK